MLHCRLLAAALLVVVTPALAQKPTSTSAVSVLSAPSVQSGEYPGLETGKMWQFDVPPLDYWKKRYGFEPSAQWLDHARLSSLRYATGCSASFVSPDGLVMTNHHCARACIESATQEGEDLLGNGFLAARREEERACKGIFLDQLEEISDVTPRVHKAIGTLSPGRAAKKRGEVIDEIEKECLAKGGATFCQVVTLYRGGQYKLYRFHRYTDIRLVMAPEGQMAFFGGDPDNFTYPRHDIDMSFVRAYVDDKPAKIEHYFTWSKAGAREGELLFVVGNPGSTGRLNTMAQLEYLRDVSYPGQLATLDRSIATVKRLSEDSARGKALRNTLFSLQNSRKAIGGYQSGLLDSTLMNHKRAWEADFRKRVAADPALRARYGTAWTDIARVQTELRAIATQRRYYQMSAYLGRLMPIAGNLVRYNSEMALPDSARLSQFHESSKAATERSMLQGAAIDTIAEREWMATWLTAMREELGPADPVVRAALKGRTPADAAADIVRRTELLTSEQRMELFQDPAKLAASKDPYLELARTIDPLDRALGKRIAALASRESAATEHVAQALLAVYGNSVAPDATFSLRISDGEVRRYPLNGTEAPPFTTFYGLYDRSVSFGNEGPYALPQRWQERKAALEMATPYNAAATNDIIGGNSGSPVINRDQEVVGLIFDGNMEMLPNRFLYTEREARAVYLDSRAIVEALRNIYDAGALADELTGKRTALR